MPDLGDYRKKRTPGATPEPFGGDGPERPGLFVVQLHAAKSRHYDLRLEIGGVLVSFAVPKGPSLDPEDKRLAVATEDHPIEYGDFEGVIPAGNYGAGSMIVWDRGRAIHHLDAEHGLGKGKLLFDLEGYKLRGLFTLVQTKRNPKEWLLIKKPDLWARAGGNVEGDLPPESVLSGLTVDELAQAGERNAQIARELDALGARGTELAVDGVELMLAETAPAPFSKPGWFFELKIDGFRLLAGRNPRAGGGPGELALRFRSGGAATATFPEITRTLRALTASHYVLDGEVTVLDDTGKPSFQRLQKRAHATRRGDAERAALEHPATFFVFDLLAFEGRDLRPLPLAVRKQFLARVVPPRGAVRLLDHVAEQGVAFFQAVEQLGLEGVIAKRANAPYQAGRGPSWLKMRVQRTADLAIVGFLRPKDKKTGLESLHLAWLDGSQWRYAGRAGSGLTTKDRGELATVLEAHRRPEALFEDAPKATVRDVWVEPREVVEVRYLEVTETGQLRHPVIQRRRMDKRAEDCTELPGAVSSLPAPEPEPPPAPVKKRVVLSRREKVFWPEDGFTKGDLLDYYQAIAPAMLPFLRDRPLVLDRYPDGITGKSFFQKNAPEGAPDWVRTEVVWSDDAGTETSYFVCDDVETLLYVVNLGAIPLHVWSSRFADLARPDWAILDLDAKGLPFSQALEVAREVGRLCAAIELPAYLKTSGASGLHVLLPTGGRLTHDQARQLAELLARVIAARRPEIASIARSPSAREGKVYVDFLQNGHGKLLVAPFSVRPRPGAPVSTPLDWAEIERDFLPEEFHLKNVPERVANQKADPWAGLFGLAPDLGKVLGRLAGEAG
jgi:bifunctional non-homologous end joining protein LigD